MHFSPESHYTAEDVMMIPYSFIFSILAIVDDAVNGVREFIAPQFAPRLSRHRQITTSVIYRRKLWCNEFPHTVFCCLCNHTLSSVF